MAQQGQSIDSANSYVIEMSQLANELSRKLAALNSSQAPVGAGRSSCPIIVAKVRDLTRNVDCGEYDPDHVAIGPYNYPRPQSKSPQLAMEHDKLTSLDKVLSAAKATTPSITVNVYVNELACLEQSVRNCYANKFDDMNSEQFVRMLLLDGCYILSRLVCFRAQPADDAPETVDVGVPSAKRAEALAVVRDVFYLAENQIPFFVLEKIGELTAVDGKDRVIKEITDYALHLMRGQKYAMAALAMVSPQPTVPGNLLHLLHMHLKPAPPSVRPAATVNDTDTVRRWRSATEYSFAGVMFKRRDMSEKGLTWCILDVKLNNSSGTLEVPCLDIDAETWRLLRNLMELEQRNRETVGSHVTAYCVFMSQLACTTKDVELLSKRGVIVHGHGNNEEVAKCFADLCKGIQFDPDDPGCNYLRETCKKLEKRFQSYPRRWTQPGFGIEFSHTCSFKTSRARMAQDKSSTMWNKVDLKSDQPFELSHQFIKKITNDYDQGLIVGIGAFRTVYKGICENGEEIAVKVLRNMTGIDNKDFQKEFENLRRLKHPNVVQLLGFCNEMEKVLVEHNGNQVVADKMHTALIFEYVRNGSLANHISADGFSRLNWHTQYKIIKGICHGLEYLQHGFELSVWHLDLKPSNILLDNNMIPKIADFGLSRLLGDENTRKTVNNVGTRGYLPPEYIHQGLISKKFDIFSLGVIIAKLMAGTEVYFKIDDMGEKGFVKHVNDNWRKRLRATLAARPLEVYCEQVRMCIQIAVKCMNRERQERPTIHSIVSDLIETEIMIGNLGLETQQAMNEACPWCGDTRLGVCYKVELTCKEICVDLHVDFMKWARIPCWGRAKFMRVANFLIDVDGTVQLDLKLLNNGIPLTLTVTNEGGRTYFHGPNWVQIATELGMQAGKAFILFLDESEEPDIKKKIYLWYDVPQSP